MADTWRILRSTLAPVTHDKSEQEKRLELIGVRSRMKALTLAFPTPQGFTPLRLASLARSDGG
jgi:hypothetical protein